MKMLITMKWSGVTPAQLDQVNNIVNLEATEHKGMILHAACFINENTLHVTDIWESVEDYNQFVQNHVMPAVAQAGFSLAPQIERFPIYDLFIPDTQQLIHRPTIANFY